MNWKELEKLEIADLIGIPYEENGRTLEGLDCYGLVIIGIYILKRKKLIDVQYDNHNIELSAEWSPLLNIKKTNSIYKGVIVEMHIGNELHIGLAINTTTMIHATRNQGVRISCINAYPVTNLYEVI